MRGYLANTDPDWFDFLAQRDDEEVNFWTPSARPFSALAEGEPLLFRLKAPRNKVGGFGIFQRYTELPGWLAWQTFGPANGAPSFDAMQARLGEIRRRNAIGGPTVIGCRLLAGPVFLPEEAWVPLPSDWRPQIVSGKGYDLSHGEGATLWRRVLEATMALRPALAAEGQPPRYGPAIPIRPRLGQAGFRVAVLDAYGRQCAVTTEHSLPVLEAAHIRPYAEGGNHQVSNGLLLRSDVHKLFDLGYVTVDPDHRFVVSQRLHNDYANGRTYYALHGQQLHLPPDPGQRPSTDALRWHRDARYLG
ncbi:MAG TPA: HNH endonuclease [Deltaproteobacteria bacterium]|nr:HNH endonuclease [Deltaproteobacteria bacterium]